MKLYISEPEPRESGPILIGDSDHNDIAEFFHNEHATVSQSYETALALAKKLVDAPREWQPIETAPKDGTHILAYSQPIGIRVTNMTNPPTVVHWFDDPEEPGFYTSVNELAPNHPFRATHWKPLDAPPSLVSRPERGGAAS